MTDKDAPLPITAAEQPSRFNMPIPLGTFGEALAWPALVVTWLGSLGQHHWALDLLSHFRLQYVVVCIIILVFAAFRRGVPLILAALISLFWNAQLIHAVHRTASAEMPLSKPSEKPLKILLFNVLGVNDNHVAAIEHVLNVDADIVCLPEVRDDWRMNLEPLRVRYPHRVEELNDGDFGIACYTRLPLKSSEVRRFPPWGLPTILLNLDHLGTPVTFLGTHPMPPLDQERAAGWRAQLGYIGSLVATIDGDVILAGDLNATPWCQGMRLLTEKSGLAFHSMAPVWPPTWGRHLPTMIPIDHILTKGSFIIRDRHIGPPMGSDHRSVMVELVR